jgi:hypothetical protein
VSKKSLRTEGLQSSEQLELQDTYRYCEHYCARSKLRGVKEFQRYPCSTSQVRKRHTCTSGRLGRTFPSRRAKGRVASPWASEAPSGTWTKLKPMPVNKTGVSIQLPVAYCAVSRITSNWSVISGDERPERLAFISPHPVAKASGNPSGAR